MLKKGGRGDPKDDIEYLADKPKLRYAIEEEKAKLIIATLLKNIREIEDISQKQLSELSGVAQPVIARIEAKKSPTLPRLDSIAKMFSAMNYSLIVSAKKNEIIT